MIPPQAFAPSTACDADPRCRHAACFQIHLEASQPQQADRQALACAYHVADVIEALRGWAREHDLAGGQRSRAELADLDLPVARLAGLGRGLAGHRGDQAGAGNLGGQARPRMRQRLRLRLPPGLTAELIDQASEPLAATTP